MYQDNKWTLLLFYLKTETDPVSETCSWKYQAMDTVKETRNHNYLLYFSDLHFNTFDFITLNYLTSCSWGLLQKQPVVHLLKNLPKFYRTRNFITIFIRALHWSLSWARSIQSITRHPISLRPVLILSTNTDTQIFLSVQIYRCLAVDSLLASS
jgi:hypothetical protein